MNKKPTLRDTWQRAQRGWPAGFPLVQFPNAPLIVALGGMLVAALTTGTLHDWARATVYAALAGWAWLELTAGSNWFRRALGAAAFVYVIANIADALA
jgi:hypothetical protein